MIPFVITRFTRSIRIALFAWILALFTHFLRNLVVSVNRTCFLALF